MMISDSIKRQQRWIPWTWAYNEKGKPIKKPLVAWSQKAQRAQFSNMGDKKGIVFDPSIDSLAGLDLDDCIIEGKYSQIALDALELFKGKAYIETSVSGTGLHFIFYSGLGISFNRSPIEYYEWGRYFTFSGNVIEGSISEPKECIEEITEFLEKYQPDELAKVGAEKVSGEPSLMSVQEIKERLSFIDPTDRGQWFQIGCALNEDFEGDETGFTLFHDWSQLADTYVSEASCRTTWESIGEYTGPRIGIGTLIRLSEEGGYKPIDPPIDPPKSLLNTSKVIVSSSLEAPQWVVDGIIPNGVGVIAGVGGIGKTTALIPLTAIVAGFDDIQADVTAKIHRHVVYITEDSVQAKKTIYGIKKHRKSYADITKLDEYLHLYHSQRYTSKELNQIILEAIEEYSRDNRGIVFPPLIVFDTASANIAVENENDNAEVAKFMTVFKQLWAKHNVPIWLITHLPKSAVGKTIDEIYTQSARGASAWRDNSSWDALLAVDDTTKHRILNMGKVREELDFRELEFSSTVHEEIVPDIFGDDVTVKYRYSRVNQSSAMVRLVQKEEVRLEQRSIKDEEIKSTILKVMKELGPSSKDTIIKSVSGKTDIKKRIFKELVEGSSVVEISKNRWVVKQ